MENTTILSLRGITKYYPGVVALNDVSLEFRRGEVHALIGENGAGKSTLIKIISGAIKPDKGLLEINGKQYNSFDPFHAKQNGIEAVYQEFNLVDSLSVAENICFGENNGFLVDFKKMYEKARKIFEEMQVDIDVKAKVRDLSTAQQQLVEIAKSISRNAKILIMDEPSAPLSVSEVRKMFEIVRNLKKNGVTIIYISHRLDELFEISDRVSVLRDGQYIKTLETSRTNPKELISLMVGRELTESFPQKRGTIGATALELKNVCGNGLKDISFTLRKGEILGIAGLVGAGRTELARLIFGADKLISGSVLINGKPVRIHLPVDAINLGIGLIPEDRKRQGCFLEKDVSWNISISNLRSLLKWKTVVDKNKEKSLAEDFYDRLNIKTPTLMQKVKNLSGGNQQKVVLAKTLATNSDIIIFDEPTRGIDVGSKQEIYHLIRDLADQGKAILMISSEMAELIGLSDRILVMYSGRITGEITKEEFSQDRILELASGLN
ncbi:MAG: sugar ABC transporter ATP-binding protein [Clostridiaceae bacterium]|nr:sugar ABC transporter ATP-binding protein [Clostridiaceae bacterium]